SCVRAPANTAICPPGLRTRIHSSHTAGGGTNESQSLPMNPPRLAGTASVSPVTHAASTSATCAGLVFDRPYGGSVMTASTELSGSCLSSSRQSPWMIFIKAFRLRHKKKGGGLPPLVRVVSVRAPLLLAPLELAGLAVIRRGLNPSAVQCLLLHPDVVDRLDPL